MMPQDYHCNDEIGAPEMGFFGSVGAEAEFNCPRRAEGPGMPRKGEGVHDKWNPGKPGEQMEEFDSCSYCGGARPSVVLAAIEAGTVEIGPTDKSYKLYLESVLSPEEIEAQDEARLKRYTSMGMTESEAKNLITQDPHHSGKMLGKVYTQHFTQEEGSRFRQLHSEGKIKWGYPGFPYTPLYMPTLPNRGA